MPASVCSFCIMLPHGRVLTATRRPRQCSRSSVDSSDANTVAHCLSGPSARGVLEELQDEGSVAWAVVRVEDQAFAERFVRFLNSEAFSSTKSCASAPFAYLFACGIAGVFLNLAEAAATEYSERPHVWHMVPHTCGVQCQTCVDGCIDRQLQRYDELWLDADHESGLRASIERDWAAFGTDAATALEELTQLAVECGHEDGQLPGDAAVRLARGAPAVCAALRRVGGADGLAAVAPAAARALAFHLLEAIGDRQWLDADVEQEVLRALEPRVLALLPAAVDGLERPGALPPLRALHAGGLLLFATHDDEEGGLPAWPRNLQVPLRTVLPASLPSCC